MGPMLVRAILPLLFLAAAAGLVGCGGDNLDDLESFDGYSLYYAGPEVDGLPIGDVVKEDFDQVEGDDRARWLIFYGDCTPSGDEGGCAPPIEIQNYPACRRWPGMYARKPRLIDFKGAKATWGGGGTFEIYTGQTTVVIFGSRAHARAVARQIRRPGQERPARTLPPPAGGSLWSMPDCPSGSE